MNAEISKLVGLTKLLQLSTLPLMLAVATPANGQGTLISQTGSFASGQNNQYYNGNLQAGGNPDLYAISWTSRSLFSGVNISVPLSRIHGEYGVAYLTQSIGPGTTVSSEIASASIDFYSPSTYLSIFSGLTLGPGTYYLTIEETDHYSGGSGIWYGTALQAYSFAPNVSPNGAYYYSGLIPDYPPSAAFAGKSIFLDYNISYTAVPDPSSAFLLSIGAGMLAINRRKSRSNFSVGGNRKRISVPAGHRH